MHAASKMDKNSDGLYALYLDKSWIEKLQRDLFEVDSYISLEANIIDDKKTYDAFILLCETLFLDDISIKKEEQIIQFISKLIVENCHQSFIHPKNILVDDIKNHIDQNIYQNLTLEEISGIM